MTNPCSRRTKRNGKLKESAKETWPRGGSWLQSQPVAGSCTYGACTGLGLGSGCLQLLGVSGLIHGSQVIDPPNLTQGCHAWSC